MLPNRFPDQGEPEFNSVDASLWFVLAVDAYLAACARRSAPPPPVEGARLTTAVEQILEGYAGGTRHRIKMASDALLACGEPGVQLTWMDARVGERVVTPRVGKPVEVQALWINALHAGAALSARWGRIEARARETFPVRFWDEKLGYLRDVVDVDHVAGEVDATLRPNQVLALGGLPVALLGPERCRRALDVVEDRLWTPMGLRTLDPGHPDYCGRYEGDSEARDSAYHQGTVWPWLTGPFVEAWVRAREGDPNARAEAWLRFVRPLQAHVGEAGIGHVSEIADGDAPHTPRGCPFQAWSVAELLRLEVEVLAGRERSSMEAVSE
jgi:predicted glycogen debranching enzyme